MKLSVSRSLLLSLAAVATTGLLTAGLVHAQSTASTASTTTTSTTNSSATALPEDRPMMGHHGEAHLQQLADLTGLSVSDLETQVNNGTPLYEYLAKQGWTLTKLQAKVLDQQKTRLADMVSSGFMTQAQSDQMLSAFQTKLSEGTGFGLGLGFGHGGPF